jgi:hypothetical protein
MSLIFPQTLFAHPAPHNLSAELVEQRAAVLLIAALCAPEKQVARLAARTDAACPPERPISQIIRFAADWLMDEIGPYGDLPFAAPFIPNLRLHLAQSGLAPNICAAVDFAYATTKDCARLKDDFHADPQDLRAATLLHHLH